MNATQNKTETFYVSFPDLVTARRALSEARRSGVDDAPLQVRVLSAELPPVQPERKARAHYRRTLRGALTWSLVASAGFTALAVAAGASPLEAAAVGVATGTLGGALGALRTGVNDSGYVPIARESDEVLVSIEAPRAEREDLASALSRHGRLFKHSAA